MEEKIEIEIAILTAVLTLLSSGIVATLTFLFTRTNQNKKLLLENRIKA